MSDSKRCLIMSSCESNDVGYVNNGGWIRVMQTHKKQGRVFLERPLQETQLNVVLAQADLILSKIDEGE